MLFKNRKDAGAQLAQQLTRYKDHPKGIVIGLARGGVVTAAEIASRLHLPLDALLVRKSGVSSCARKL